MIDGELKHTQKKNPPPLYHARSCYVKDWCTLFFFWTLLILRYFVSPSFPSQCKCLTEAIWSRSIKSLLPFSVPSVVTWRSQLISYCLLKFALLLWMATLDNCEHLGLTQTRREALFSSQAYSFYLKSKSGILCPWDVSGSYYLTQKVSSCEEAPYQVTF